MSELAVDRQPWLPHGMTRRALLQALYDVSTSSMIQHLYDKQYIHFPSIFDFFRKFSKFSKILHFLKNLFVGFSLATAHSQTQRRHLWMSYDQGYSKKLLPVKTNLWKKRLAARGRPSTMVTARKACRDECSPILLDIAKEF